MFQSMFGITYAKRIQFESQAIALNLRRFQVGMLMLKAA